MAFTVFSAFSASKVFLACYFCTLFRKISYWDVENGGTFVIRLTPLCRMLSRSQPLLSSSEVTPASWAGGRVSGTTPEHDRHFGLVTKPKLFQKTKTEIKPRLKCKWELFYFPEVRKQKALVPTESETKLLFHLEMFNKSNHRSEKLELIQHSRWWGNAARSDRPGVLTSSTRGPGSICLMQTTDLGPHGLQATRVPILPSEDPNANSPYHQ